MVVAVGASFELARPGKISAVNEAEAGRLSR